MMDGNALRSSERRGRPLRAVLGLAALGHDPAVCLFLDGVLVAAVEEERLNRQRRTEAFPHRAIAFVLAKGGIAFRDLDAIAYYWDDRGMLPAVVGRTLAHLPEHPGGMLRLLGDRLGSYWGPTVLRERLAAHCDGDFKALPPIHCIAHHEAHLAAAWLSAPFEPDAALILDGRGEYAATSVYRINPASGGRGSASLLEDYAFPNSLGVFFGALTQHLGYRALSDEYKVMGLASYGAPDAAMQQRMAQFLALYPDGRYRLSLRYLHPERCSGSPLSWLNAAGKALFPGRFQDENGLTDEARALAYATQERLEVAMTGLVRRLVQRTGARRLVLAGGVTMNACAIGRLRASGLVEQVYVPLAPADSGACIGAALALLRRDGAAQLSREGLDNPYQGPSYSEQQIEQVLQHARWSYRRAEDPAVEAARELAAGRIIGWFDGRMEFGERALGARSILGDPRDAATRDRINALVKRRESYRPFAPSILEEDAPEYFEITRSRRMSEIVRVKDVARERAPAVVHVDGTARPQTVPRDVPVASFRRLIEAFKELTGVPLVVNTSFNVRDEPIVCSPEDALRCYAASGLERLYIGPYVVSKGVET
ncbi:carbamoyltransferase C-terminal domain-containing protein [Sorangium sp. So ce764]|uniref:carbamoyltransferase family protein n=1 Tax=Sorangium sp. So ce764 TaxID=3133320 RepID=UPI003F62DF3D